MQALQLFSVVVISLMSCAVIDAAPTAVSITSGSNGNSLYYNAADYNNGVALSTSGVSNVTIYLIGLTTGASTISIQGASTGVALHLSMGTNLSSLEVQTSCDATLNFTQGTSVSNVQLLSGSTVNLLTSIPFVNTTTATFTAAGTIQMSNTTAEPILYVLAGANAATALEVTLSTATIIGCTRLLHTEGDSLEGVNVSINRASIEGTTPYPPAPFIFLETLPARLLSVEMVESQAMDGAWSYMLSSGSPWDPIQAPIDVVLTNLSYNAIASQSSNFVVVGHGWPQINASIVKNTITLSPQSSSSITTTCGFSILEGTQIAVDTNFKSYMKTMIAMNVVTIMDSAGTAEARDASVSCPNSDVSSTRICYNSVVLITQPSFVYKNVSIARNLNIMSSESGVIRNIVHVQCHHNTGENCPTESHITVLSSANVQDVLNVSNNLVKLEASVLLTSYTLLHNINQPQIDMVASNVAIGTTESVATDGPVTTDINATVLYNNMISLGKDAALHSVTLLRGGQCNHAVINHTLSYTDSANQPAMLGITLFEGFTMSGNLSFPSVVIGYLNISSVVFTYAKNVTASSPLSMYPPVNVTIALSALPQTFDLTLFDTVHSEIDLTLENNYVAAVPLYSGIGVPTQSAFNVTLCRSCSTAGTASVKNNSIFIKDLGAGAAALAGVVWMTPLLNSGENVTRTVSGNVLFVGGTNDSLTTNATCFITSSSDGAPPDICGNLVHMRNTPNVTLTLCQHCGSKSAGVFVDIVNNEILSVLPYAQITANLCPGCIAWNGGRVRANNHFIRAFNASSFVVSFGGIDVSNGTTGTVQWNKMIAGTHYWALEDAGYTSRYVPEHRWDEMCSDLNNSFMFTDRDSFRASGLRTLWDYLPTNMTRMFVTLANASANGTGWLWDPIWHIATTAYEMENYCENDPTTLLCTTLASFGVDPSFAPPVPDVICSANVLPKMIGNWYGNCSHLTSPTDNASWVIPCQLLNYTIAACDITRAVNTTRIPLTAAVNYTHVCTNTSVALSASPWLAWCHEDDIWSNLCAATHALNQSCQVVSVLRNATLVNISEWEGVCAQVSDVLGPTTPWENTVNCTANPHAATLCGLSEQLSAMCNLTRLLNVNTTWTMIGNKPGSIFEQTDTFDICSHIGTVLNQQWATTQCGLYYDALLGNESNSSLTSSQALLPAAWPYLCDTLMQLNQSCEVAFVLTNTTWGNCAYDHNLTCNRIRDLESTPWFEECSLQNESTMTIPSLHTPCNLTKRINNTCLLKASIETKSYYDNCERELDPSWSSVCGNVAEGEFGSYYVGTFRGAGVVVSEGSCARDNATIYIRSNYFEAGNTSEVRGVFCDDCHVTSMHRDVILPQRPELILDSYYGNSSEVSFRNGHSNDMYGFAGLLHAYNNTIRWSVFDSPTDDPCVEAITICRSCTSDAPNGRLQVVDNAFVRSNRSELEVGDVVDTLLGWLNVTLCENCRSSLERNSGLSSSLYADAILNTTAELLIENNTGTSAGAHNGAFVVCLQCTQGHGGQLMVLNNTVRARNVGMGIQTTVVIADAPILDHTTLLIAQNAVSLSIEDVDVNLRVAIPTDRRCLATRTSSAAMSQAGILCGNVVVLAGLSGRQELTLCRDCSPINHNRSLELPRSSLILLSNDVSTYDDNEDKTSTTLLASLCSGCSGNVNISRNKLKATGNWGQSMTPCLNCRVVPPSFSWNLTGDGAAALNNVSDNLLFIMNNAFSLAATNNGSSFSFINLGTQGAPVLVCDNALRTSGGSYSFDTTMSTTRCAIPDSKFWSVVANNTLSNTFVSDLQFTLCDRCSVTEGGIIRIVNQSLYVYGDTLSARLCQQCEVSGAASELLILNNEIVFSAGNAMTLYVSDHTDVSDTTHRISWNDIALSECSSLPCPSYYSPYMTRIDRYARCVEYARMSSANTTTSSGGGYVNAPPVGSFTCGNVLRYLGAADGELTFSFAHDHHVNDALSPAYVEFNTVSGSSNFITSSGTLDFGGWCDPCFLDSTTSRLLVRHNVAHFGNVLPSYNLHLEHVWNVNVPHVIVNNRILVTKGVSFANPQILSSLADSQTLTPDDFGIDRSSSMTFNNTIIARNRESIAMTICDGCQARGTTGSISILNNTLWSESTSGTAVGSLCTNCSSKSFWAKNNTINVTAAAEGSLVLGLIQFDNAAGAYLAIRNNLMYGHTTTPGTQTSSFTISNHALIPRPLCPAKTYIGAYEWREVCGNLFVTLDSPVNATMGLSDGFSNSETVIIANNTIDVSDVKSATVFLCIRCTAVTKNGGTIGPYANIYDIMDGTLAIQNTIATLRCGATSVEFFPDSATLSGAKLNAVWRNLIFTDGTFSDEGDSLVLYHGRSDSTIPIKVTENHVATITTNPMMPPDVSTLNLTLARQLCPLGSCYNQISVGNSKAITVTMMAKAVCTSAVTIVANNSIAVDNVSAVVVTLAYDVKGNVNLLSNTIRIVCNRASISEAHLSNKNDGYVVAFDNRIYMRSTSVTLSLAEEAQGAVFSGLYNLVNATGIQRTDVATLPILDPEWNITNCTLTYSTVCGNVALIEASSLAVAMFANLVNADLTTISYNTILVDRVDVSIVQVALGFTFKAYPPTYELVVQENVIRVTNIIGRLATMNQTNCHLEGYCQQARPSSTMNEKLSGTKLVEAYIANDCMAATTTVSDNAISVRNVQAVQCTSCIRSWYNSIDDSAYWDLKEKNATGNVMGPAVVFVQLSRKMNGTTKLIIQKNHIDMREINIQTCDRYLYVNVPPACDSDSAYTRGNMVHAVAAWAPAITSDMKIMSNTIDVTANPLSSLHMTVAALSSPSGRGVYRAEGNRLVVIGNSTSSFVVVNLPEAAYQGYCPTSTTIKNNIVTTTGADVGMGVAFVMRFASSCEAQPILLSKNVIRSVGSTSATAALLMDARWAYSASDVLLHENKIQLFNVTHPTATLGFQVAALEQGDMIMCDNRIAVNEDVSHHKIDDNDDNTRSVSPSMTLSDTKSQKPTCPTVLATRMYGNDIVMEGSTSATAAFCMSCIRTGQEPYIPSNVTILYNDVVVKHMSQGPVNITLFSDGHYEDYLTSNVQHARYRSNTVYVRNVSSGVIQPFDSTLGDISTSLAQNNDYTFISAGRVNGSLISTSRDGLGTDITIIASNLITTSPTESAPLSGASIADFLPAGWVTAVISNTIRLLPDDSRSPATPSTIDTWTVLPKIPASGNYNISNNVITADVDVMPSPTGTANNATFVSTGNAFTARNLTVGQGTNTTLISGTLPYVEVFGDGSTADSFVFMTYGTVQGVKFSGTVTNTFINISGTNFLSSSILLVEGATVSDTIVYATNFTFQSVVQESQSARTFYGQAAGPSPSSVNVISVADGSIVNSEFHFSDVNLRLEGGSLVNLKNSTLVGGHYAWTTSNVSNGRLLYMANSTLVGGATISLEECMFNESTEVIVADAQCYASNAIINITGSTFTPATQSMYNVADLLAPLGLLLYYDTSVFTGYMSFHNAVADYGLQIACSLFNGFSGYEMSALAYFPYIRSRALKITSWDGQICFTISSSISIGSHTRSPPTNTTAMSISSSKSRTVNRTITPTHGTLTKSVSVTKIPTPTPTVTLSLTHSESESPTRSMTPSRTHSLPPTVSPSSSLTETLILTPSMTETTSPTPTTSRTPSRSHTPSRTATPSSSGTHTVSRTRTPSRTATPSSSGTHTVSRTRTPSRTATPSLSHTSSGSQSLTPSLSYTHSPSSSRTPSPSTSRSASLSLSASPSLSLSYSITLPLRPFDEANWTMVIVLMCIVGVVLLVMIGAVVYVKALRTSSSVVAASSSDVVDNTMPPTTDGSQKAVDGDVVNVTHTRVDVAPEVTDTDVTIQVNTSSVEPFV